MSSTLYPYLIPLGALIISAIALVYVVFGYKQRTEADLVTQLYQRISDLEGQIALQTTKYNDLDKKYTELHAENWQLMRRLLDLEHINDQKANK